MAQKAKARTGAALPTTDQPDDDSDSQYSESYQPPPLSDAQAAGFTSTDLAPPAPAGPSMGGDYTQASDFAQKVAKATNVPSKGGPAEESLYVSSGKGPVGPLKRPQDTSEGTFGYNPEYKPPPLPPPSARPQPEIAATPSPAAAPPATTQPVDQTAPATQGQPPPAAAPEEQPPSFQHHGDLIEQYAKRYQEGPQDYSRLDPYILNDPDFAGTINGHPIFMDPQRRVYMRDETGPGQETRHYADAQYGTEEAKSGIKVVDEQKAQASRDAQARMGALLQTKDAIDDWQKKLDDYKAKHGDENPIQQLNLQAQMGGGTDIWSNLQKFGAGITGGMIGVNDDMKKLDVARSQAAASYGQAWTKNLPVVQGTREALSLPMTNDDFTTQQAKVDGMKAAMAREARSLQVMYPYGNKALEKVLTSIGQGGGVKQPGGQQNAPAASTTRPGGTAAAPSSVPDVTGNAGAYNALKSGDSFIYKGKTFRKK